MKTCFLILCVLLLANLANSQQRRALVIGNSKYQDNALRNPENDARDVANSLQALGFQATLMTNVNQRQMEKSINDFSAKLQSGDIALFYYSGRASILCPGYWDYDFGFRFVREYYLKDFYSFTLLSLPALPAAGRAGFLFSTI